MRKIKNLWWVLCVALVMQVLSAFSVSAAPEPKVVRVGWYESAWHRTDPFGRRSGYGYEYQQRVATYTGWKYEYVYGSWSELLQKLIAGEIDLLSDVSYTKERAEKLLYSFHPMGSEDYHVFISPTNTQIRPDDYSTMNGKVVGVNKSSIQEKLYRDWAEKNGVQATVREMTEKTPVLFNMLAHGDIDMLVTLDTYGNSANVIPVVKVGFAESYFGVNKNRPDLKRELDVAMSRILESSRDFNQQLTQKFNRSSAVNSFLTAEERDWVQKHGVIRIGYQDNFLPFCNKDEASQQLTGALKDYLGFASHALKNATLSFEPRAYSDTREALAALTRGEVDCVFPINLSPFDGEKAGVLVSDPLIDTEIYAALRAGDRKGVSLNREMVVAVPRFNAGYETFIKDNFPNWQAVTYDRNEGAFHAVTGHNADCLLVSSFRVNRVNKYLRKHNFQLFTTNRSMAMSFAVRRQDTNLYSIINKINHLVSRPALNSSLITYGVDDTKPTLMDFLLEYWSYLLLILLMVAGFFLLMAKRNAVVKAVAEERSKIIAETERDDLTKLYTWKFFLFYVNQLYASKSRQPMDAVILNVDRFHSVNALHGRDFGDRVLKDLAAEIQRFADETHSKASRSGADRFNIYSPHREDWQAQFSRFQAFMDKQFPSANIHLRMGVKPWQEDMRPEVQFDCARIACNKLRGAFRDEVVIFDTEMGEKEDRDQRLLNDLPRALEKGELEVYYQPKYDIHDEKPKLYSAEALVRWRHPELGLIPPCDFIPLFEQTGQVSELDVYVWKEAARQIATWRDQYGVTLPVSVNLSRVDVFAPGLIDTLDEIVRRHELKASDMRLEVTESAYTDNPEQLIEVIKLLRSKGYEIEMDDFGSGYSSLNMLSSMPVDVLKMDIAFIRNIERNEKDFKLVELVVDIARNLKVPVIAEGVETAGQLKLLRNAGCFLVQGYYFSRPLPAAEFERKVLKGQSGEEA